MALTASTMPALGSPAPEFELPDTTGRTVTLHQLDDATALLVVFMCNHCPYTRHILLRLAELVRDYEPHGLAAVGINANDPAQQPEDGPERMAGLVGKMGLSFPYLFDASQEVAKAYGAACTPDFFLYDRGRTLAYRGRFDDSRPDNDAPVTGEPLRTAIDAVLAGETPPEPQKPSVGCNITWRAGNEPEYAREQQAAS